MRRLSAWAPPVLWAALLFAASSVDLGPGPVRVRHLDKAVHFVEYGVLGLLVARALVLTRPDARPLRTLLVAATVSTLYGASDEIHQSFVPGRDPEVADIVADALGSLAGAGLRLALTRRSAPRTR